MLVIENKWCVNPFISWRATQCCLSHCDNSPIPCNNRTPCYYVVTLLCPTKAAIRQVHECIFKKICDCLTTAGMWDDSQHLWYVDGGKLTFIQKKLSASSLICQLRLQLHEIGQICEESIFSEAMHFPVNPLEQKESRACFQFPALFLLLVKIVILIPIDRFAPKVSDGCCLSFINWPADFKIAPLTWLSELNICHIKEIYISMKEKKICSHSAILEGLWIGRN